MRPRLTNNEFFAGIRRWALAKPTWDEGRYYASLRMIDAYVNQRDYLTLSSLNLTSLPPEIGQISSLRELYAGSNRLTSVPEEIANLTNLERLGLFGNQLTSIPDAILTRPGNNRRIYLRHNIFSDEEAARMADLAQASGTALFTTNFDMAARRNEFLKSFNVPQSLLDLTPSEEKRKELENFIRNETSADFKRFLTECPRTSGWQNQEAEMTSSLFKIITKMQENPAVKEECEFLASEAFGTCGDRVSLSFVQMQIAILNPQQNLEDLSLPELLESSKQQAVAQFLLSAAKEKVEELKKEAREELRKTGRSFNEEDVNEKVDEIEVYLAYLQPAREVGLNLEATSMLYRRCAKVSDEELEEAKSTIRKIGIGNLASEHIYNDTKLREHPDITEILTTLGKKPEFSLDPLDEEQEKEFLDRCNNMPRTFTAAVVQKIQAQAQLQETAKSFWKETLKNSTTRIRQNKAGKLFEETNQEFKGSPHK